MGTHSVEVKSVIFSFAFLLNGCQLLKTNILYYREHTPSHYWFYDPVMSLPMRDGVFPLKK